MGKRESIVAAVAQYVERGWTPVPTCRPIGEGRCAHHKRCRKPGKVMLVDLPLSRPEPPPEREIERWWRDWPDANLALALAASGLAVLDVDNPGLLDRIGHLPLTPLAHTGREGGGRHLYFKRPEGLDRSLRGPGIELLVNSIAIAPPSLHPSGRRYTWAINPDEVEPAPLPDLRELLPRLRLSKPSVRRAIRGVPEGMRNISATVLAGKLLGALPPKDWPLALELLLCWNLRNHPPLPEAEVREVFNKIARRELEKQLENSDNRLIYLKILDKLEQNPHLTDSKLFALTNARRLGLRMATFARLAALARLELELGLTPENTNPPSSFLFYPPGKQSQPKAGKMGKRTAKGGG